MTLWAEWREQRERRRRALAYLRTLLAEPAEADVRWLASHGTDGDLDHARWELRYARRALGLIAAERDALDDRTGSLVAEVLAGSVARDPHVAPEKRPVAARQLNARLSRYTEALSTRGAERSTRLRLALVLLAFAGRHDETPLAVQTRAGDLLAGYLAEANDALRREFGVAALPDDLAPSAARVAG